MRIIAWLFNLLLFLVALGFALSNTSSTELRFAMAGDGVAWRAPLVIFLLVFFVAGAAVGLLSAIPSYFRQRREIARLRRELRASAGRIADPGPDEDTPAPEAVAIPPRLGG